MKKVSGKRGLGGTYGGCQIERAQLGGKTLKSGQNLKLRKLQVRKKRKKKTETEADIAKGGKD